MPKIPLKFGRRKSSGNILDPQQESAEPTQSSFRVLDRPEKAGVDGDRGDRRDLNRVAGRPIQSPFNPLRGKSADDLRLNGDRWVPKHTTNASGPVLKDGRGSGGTTASRESGHAESSGASARYSSTSTLPSSVDHEQDPAAEEDIFPLKPNRSATTSMPQNGAVDDALPPVPSFATRTGRALSFGLKGRLNSSQSNKTFSVLHNGQRSPEERTSPNRHRAETASSYASTAVPPRLDGNPNIGRSDFGDDFSSMFTPGRVEQPPPPPPPHAFHRTESEPMYPPRTHSRQAFTPSPNPDSTRQNAGSPYLDDDYGTQEREGFLSGSAISSPRVPLPTAHLSNYLNKASGYAPVGDRQPSPGFERMSSDSYASSIDEGSKERETQKPAPKQLQLDEQDRYLKRHQLADPPTAKHSASSSRTSVQPPPSSGASTLRATGHTTLGPNRSDTTSPGISDGGSLFAESSSATPRATKLHPRVNEDDTFLDISPSGPPSRAIRPAAGRSQTDSTGGTPKKMTNAQFEALQRHESAYHSEEEQDSEAEYSDEDDVERAKQITKQRRKQEANMSVYRQQMKRVAGGGPTDLPSGPSRPDLNRSSNSAPPTTGISGLHLGGIDGRPPSAAVPGKHDSDEDDDVPLGILQAHGFPGVNRPPSRGDNAGHAKSVAGSIAGGGAGQGNLPPFARRLPADPYFGASLVNQSNREPLPFNSGASVYGMPPSAPPPQMAAQLAPPQLGHPGGLVGVIAGEERARAARRGSPNAQGMYNSTPMPLPQNIPSQMPTMGRTMSMGNIVAPSTYMPSGAPPMPPMMPMMNMQGMPDQTQQQMQQFMQMQMQFMQNMMAMQQGQVGQGQQLTNDFLAPPGMNQQRPTSMASQPSFSQFPSPNQGRSMTMMNPPPTWGHVQQPVRPISGMPQSNGYAPSVNGLNISGGGPGPGYTPSIAPSERSNIGMPSRYRPVTYLGEDSSSQGRAPSLAASSMTLQAFTDGFNTQSTPNLLRPEPTQLHQQHAQPSTASPAAAARSTIRIVDKPRGAPKAPARANEDDEDEGWADMRKKREQRKTSKWGKKDKQNGGDHALGDPSFDDLYKSFE